MKRKIAFLHVHKAGGTSFVDLARRNCRLHEPNKNGNPYDGTGQILRFWHWPEGAQRLVFSSTYFDFVAREGPIWGIERYDWVDWVTILRHPFDRALSHYHQEWVGRQTGPRPTAETEDAVVRIMRGHRIFDNFITRQFLRTDPKAVTEAHLAEALETLDSFRFVFDLAKLADQIGAMAALGWTDLEMTRKAVASPEGYGAIRADCPGLMAYLEEASRFDRVLYDEVRAGRFAPGGG